MRALRFAAYGAALFAWQTSANYVFSHYMVGDSTKEHRTQDIDDAVAMGIDGFSLNIGDPTQPFVKSTLDDLFTYAAANYPSSFLLHFSMDLWAAGDKDKDAFDYIDLLKEYINHAAYEKRTGDSKPMVTTFSDGAMINETVVQWKKDLGTDIFFIPDFDGTEGYYEAADGWWWYWGDFVDGLFSWEAGWPERVGFGGDFPGDIGPDEPQMNACASHDKKYMINLSPLQYKNAYNTSVYREGGLNLPQRMANILEHRSKIDFVNLVTWNDGPESHYIGNLWTEQNEDKFPALYATDARASHKGWRKLIQSFNTAYKTFKNSASDMRPADGESVTGAFWYKTILSSVTCALDPGDDYDPSDETAQYFTKPDGYENSKDVLTYAVVLPDGASDWSLTFNSGSDSRRVTGLSAGLNFGQVDLSAGTQSMEIFDSAGLSQGTAVGSRCVYDNLCPDCVYNMNPQVVAFGDKPEGDVTCDEYCDNSDIGDGNDDDPDDSTDCKGLGDANQELCKSTDRKTATKWNCFNIGGWLVSTTTSYITRSQWDFDGKGLPEVLASYNGFYEDTEKNWDWNCANVQNTCAVSGLDVDATCEDNYRRNWALIAMQNFANILHTFHEDLQDAYITAGLQSASRLSTYTNLDEATDSDDSILSSSAWLGVASAAIGTFSSFAGPSGPAIGTVGNVLGIAGTIAGDMEEEADPLALQFKTWSTITSGMGDIYAQAQSAVKSYFDQTLNQPPPKVTEDNDWIDRNTSLPRLLEDGSFINWQSVSESSRDPALIKAIATAPLISMLWTAVSNAYLVKITDGHFAWPEADIEWRPCDHQGNWEQGMNIDDYRVCIKEGSDDTQTAYIFMMWTGDVTDADAYFELKGLDDIADDISISPEGVVRSSIQTQAHASNWTETNISNFWQGYTDGGETFVADDWWRYAQFSLPICDMDAMAMDEWYYCSGGSASAHVWKQCFIATMNDYCLQGMTLNGNKWPYEGETTDDQLDVDNN